MPKKSKKDRGERAKRLCAVIENKGYTGTRELVREPEYICVRCGRAANQMASLCSPEALEG
jgi:hypothetical protein